MTTTSASKSENHFLEIERAKLRREANGMDSLRRLANPPPAPYAFDTVHRHTHTHTHYTSSFPQSMEDEKPMSVRILILKSTMF